jgi:hypothetical protein
MTHLNPIRATAWLWRAASTEPGVDAVRHEATNADQAPAPIKPVAAIGAGLVHAESLFGAWELIGTVHGTALRNAYDEPVVQLWAPLMYGVTLGVDEIVSNGWFQAVAA